MKNVPSLRFRCVIRPGSPLVFVLAIAAILHLATAFSAPWALAAAPVRTAPPPPEYTTTHEMSTETKVFSQILTFLHYAKKPIKSVNGDEFIRDYLGKLDYSHLFFTKSELRFYQNRFAPLLDIYFERGNLAPAFTIYKDFYEKLEKRVAWIEKRLAQPFDLNTDETFVADRRKLDWPESAAEADRLWENRLKLDLIFEVLSNEAKTAAAAKKKKKDGVDAPVTGEAPSDAAATDTPPAKIAPVTPDPKVLAEAIERVRKRYQKNLTYLRFEPFEAQEIYLNTLGSEYDPHTSFFSRQSRQDFEISMRNKLIGIGAVLRDEDGYCTIREILAGGPVEGSKRIRVGDRIIAVGQGGESEGELTDVIGMRLNKIISLLRGKEGTAVRLRIEPAANRANRYTIALTRAEIKLTTKLATAVLHEVPAPDNSRTIPIGIVELPAFYGKSDGDGSAFSTTDDVAELIRKLKNHKIEGLVLDFRRNGGGLLDEAVRLTGLFVPSNHPVVQVKNSNAPSSHLNIPDNSVPLWDGPLAVLTSKMSASASEIVAGALQDHQRAIVIGDPQTHGKGSVQQVMNYSNFVPSLGSAAKFTTQKWYLPSGKSIQLKGVAADIPAPSAYSVLPISESDLDHPLPWDSIPGSIQGSPADYIPASGFVSPELISRLRANSETRQKSLPEFANLNRVLAWTKSREHARAWPIHYARLREERKNDRQLTAEIRKAYAALASESFKATDIKLDSAIEQEKKERLAREEREKADALTKGGDASAPADAATSGDASEENEDEEEDAAEVEEDGAGANFDVQSREALRVLADWLTPPAKADGNPKAAAPAKVASVSAPQG
ncbi:MAG: carboxy terminal-processing peptidase [Puniceicoccales bacterium]|nr:carboxy terminal-processing peptidase [Puniceicoccales bacterium]